MVDKKASPIAEHLESEVKIDPASLIPGQAREPYGEAGMNSITEPPLMLKVSELTIVARHRSNGHCKQQICLHLRGLRYSGWCNVWL
jgi:hypothetical protein